MRVNPKQVRSETLINYLEKNYKRLTKEQLFDISLAYIKAVYMKNGNLHVGITNEILKKYEEE